MNYLEESDSEDELPPGWEERVTLDGNVYYVHHYKQATQWIHPRSGRKKVVTGDLPPDWKKCVSDDGKVVYINHTNNTTTYTDPRLAFATEYMETSQPTRQRFDGSSTAMSVLHGQDLRGKYALITGANTGIGFETARSLALHGCTVILACRDIKKANDAINKIKNENNTSICETLEIDLSSLKSVKDAVDNFKYRHKTLDILILNAGVFCPPYTQTIDGYELTFQVNHLSQFYLTLLLDNPLRNADKPRIIIVSSESHRFSSITSIDDLQEFKLSPPASKYWTMSAYNNSKLMNLLFTKELSKRWQHVTILCCHPGNLVNSDISRYSWIFKILFLLVKPFTKSLQQAASTTVYCAIAQELIGNSGLYFNNCHQCDPSNYALDTLLATKLWTISQEMILNIMEKK